MSKAADILCIGSVLWDMSARAPVAMRVGSDNAGRIERIPGGVALNSAMTLARNGLTPALLSAVGRDPEGDELIAACEARGLITDHVHRSDDLPTDQYMAIEGAMASSKVAYPIYIVLFGILTAGRLLLVTRL